MTTRPPAGSDSLSPLSPETIARMLESEEYRRGYEFGMSDPTTVALLERSKQTLRESEELARKSEETLARLRAQAPTPTSLPGVNLDGHLSTEVLEVIGKRPRGVYATSAENVGPDGAVRWWVVDAAGVVIFAGRSLHHAASRQGLVNALHDMLDKVCPGSDEDEAAAVSEHDRVRALLDVSDGGNRPVRGRPRTKRRLSVVRGALGAWRVGRRG